VWSEKAVYALLDHELSRNAIVRSVSNLTHTHTYICIYAYSNFSTLVCVVLLCNKSKASFERRNTSYKPLCFKANSFFSLALMNISFKINILRHG